MSNFLDNLVARSLNLLPLVRPRLRSRFEPPPLAGGVAWATAFDAEATETEPGDPSVIDAQTPARPTAAAATESRPTVSNSPRPLEAPREQVDDAGQTGSPPPPFSPPRRPAAHVPVQPIKAERLHTPTAMAIPSARPEPPPSTSAVGSQTGAATLRGTLKKETEAETARVSSIRRVVAEQLDARPAQITPPISPHTGPTPTSRAESRETVERAPIIRVTIGRIEVRAVTTPAPPEPRRADARPRPVLTLEDYLKQRSGGRQ